jgi:hypothetical protein
VGTHGSAGDFASCDVIEMRRYLLHPGRFDDLQEVFQRWFVAGQERAGMRLGGQFRDRDRPDRFVWFRGFASMAQRHRALDTFYLGPVWQAHRNTANATMIDSDDVLLLRPTEPAHRPGAPASSRGPGPTAGPTWAVTQVWSLPAETDLANLLAATGHDVLRAVLGVPVAMWRTEPSPNTFHRLPVREGNFLVWLAVFEDEEHWSRAAAQLGTDPAWQRITDHLADAGAASEVIHLQPTATSSHPMPAVLLDAVAGEEGAR